MNENKWSGRSVLLPVEREQFAYVQPRTLTSKINEGEQLGTRLALHSTIDCARNETRSKLVPDAPILAGTRIRVSAWYAEYAQYAEYASIRILLVVLQNDLVTPMLGDDDDDNVGDDVHDDNLCRHGPHLCVASTAPISSMS